MGLLLLAIATTSLVTGSAPANEPPEHDAETIRIAVFRHQVEDVTKGEPERLVCLQVEEDGETSAPSQSLLKSFADDDRVRSVASCEVAASGVVEAETRRPAILLTVRTIKHVSPSEAHVDASYYRDARRSGHHTYRLVLEDSKWSVLGPILLGIVPEYR